jgi:Uma2 family endonuclease
MAVVRQQVTANELLYMPDDGYRYELVRGELRQLTPAGNVHGRVAMNFAWRLAQYVQENGLGAAYAAETGFRLATDPDTVRAPDVAFVSHVRVEAVGEVEGFWPGAPDLAVEVISPDDAYADVEEKVFDWLDAGTRMVVVVNPRQHSATVYKSQTDITALTEADVLDGDDIVPGFELTVREIFA